jgi:hypothetical protein
MNKNTLYQTYVFPGFTPLKKLRGLAGDPDAWIIVLERHQKKLFAQPAAKGIERFTTTRPNGFGTGPAATCTFTCKWGYAG